MRAIFENVKEAIACKVDKYGHINGFKAYAGKSCIVIILEEDTNENCERDTTETGEKDCKFD